MPRSDRLYELAAAQGGLFTTSQAARAGYSPQLLVHHVAAGRFLRVRRGIYRLVQFPAGEHEDFVAAWLWSERRGVISHDSALALLELSDALPAHLHLTLPASARTRRLRVPEGVRLHFADVGSDERAWFGPVPLTTVARTLADCAREGFAPDLLRQAALQARGRGLVATGDLMEVRRALQPFGGLPV